MGVNDASWHLGFIITFSSFSSTFTDEQFGNNCPDTIHSFNEAFAGMEQHILDTNAEKQQS